MLDFSSPCPSASIRGSNFFIERLGPEGLPEISRGRQPPEARGNSPAPRRGGRMATVLVKRSYPASAVIGFAGSCSASTSAMQRIPLAAQKGVRP